MKTPVRKRLAAKAAPPLSPFKERWSKIGIVTEREPRIPKGQIVTEPNQVKPLDRILQMMSQGIQVPELRGLVDGDTSPDYFKMDAGEIMEERHKVADAIADHQQKLHDINVALKTVRERRKAYLDDLNKKQSSKADATPGQGQSPAAGGTHRAEHDRQ